MSNNLNPQKLNISNFSLFSFLNFINKLVIVQTNFFFFFFIFLRNKYLEF